jgi:hypothetical protein
VGFAVEHAVTLLDGGVADGLRQVTLASAGRTEKQGVFVACDKSTGGEIEDQAAIHLLIEVKVEVVEGLLRVAELSLLFPSVLGSSRRTYNSSHCTRSTRPIQPGGAP